GVRGWVEGGAVRPHKLQRGSAAESLRERTRGGTSRDGSINPLAEGFLPHPSSSNQNAGCRALPAKEGPRIARRGLPPLTSLLSLLEIESNVRVRGHSLRNARPETPSGDNEDPTDRLSRLLPVCPNRLQSPATADRRGVAVRLGALDVVQTSENRDARLSRSGAGRHTFGDAAPAGVGRVAEGTPHCTNR